MSMTHASRKSAAPSGIAAPALFRVLAAEAVIVAAAITLIALMS